MQAPALNFFEALFFPCFQCPAPHPTAFTPALSLQNMPFDRSWLL